MAELIDIFAWETVGICAHVIQLQTGETVDVVLFIHLAVFTIFDLKRAGCAVGTEKVVALHAGQTLSGTQTLSAPFDSLLTSHTIQERVNEVRGFALDTANIIAYQTMRKSAVAGHTDSLL